jgi:hypothetical protein
LRYLYALIGLSVLLAAATAAAGSFKAEMDVDTYVTAEDANQSFSEDDILWATSQGAQPVSAAYLSFINNFGTIGIFKPDDIQAATLKVYATDVETPGKINVYLIHGAVLDTATWYDRPLYGTNATASFDVEEAGEYTVDVTPLIKEAVKTCVEGCPYSIALVAGDNTSVGFASMESSGEKAELSYTTAD